MAKKNKIEFNPQELTPHVLGTVETTSKGLIPLLVIFAFIFAFIFYVDTINLWFETYILKLYDEETEIYIPNELDEDEDDIETGQIPEEEIEVDLEYTLSNDLIIENEIFIINNITTNDNVISFLFDITNSSLYAESDYYLEMYSVDNTLIKRISLVNLGDNVTITKSYLGDVSYLKLNVISEVSYPLANFSDDGSGVLSCTNNVNTAKYNFVDSKLTYVDYTINTTGYYNEYLLIKNEYSSYEGAEVYMYGSIFTLKCDLNSCDLSRINIDDVIYNYGLGDSVDKVKYLTEMDDYICSVIE